MYRPCPAKPIPRGAFLGAVDAPHSDGGAGANQKHFEPPLSFEIFPLAVTTWTYIQYAECPNLSNCKSCPITSGNTNFI
jgi:hypothetical protein